MGEFTENRPVFLNFCLDALEKLRDQHTFEADQLRVELEALAKRLEGWAHLPNPPDKDRTIAAVMSAYRRALDMCSSDQDSKGKLSGSG